jgi:hypothetical protein
LRNFGIKQKRKYRWEGTHGHSGAILILKLQVGKRKEILDKLTIKRKF